MQCQSEKNIVQFLIGEAALVRGVRDGGRYDLVDTGLLCLPLTVTGGAVKPSVVQL